MKSSDLIRVFDFISFKKLTPRDLDFLSDFLFNGSCSYAKYNRLRSDYFETAYELTRSGCYNILRKLVDIKCIEVVGSGPRKRYVYALTEEFKDEMGLD